VADWILTPHGKLTDDYHAVLNAITARRPELDATRTLVRQFADMLTRRQGSKLPRWADQAEASDVPELRSFAPGRSKDCADRGERRGKRPSRCSTSPFRP
jgi:hypothetical protein